MMEGIDGLSPRQKEILALVAQGLPIKAVGLLLEPPCSSETVKKQLSEIYRRLGVSGRVEAAIMWSQGHPSGG
jgi:DNA-binding NarL/FixJ family response regulator